MKKRRASFSEEMRTAVEGLPVAELKELVQAVRAGAKEKGLYIEPGQNVEEPIPMALTPWVFSPEAARYLKGFFRGIRRTVNRVLVRYFDDPRLQAILPLRESELKWLKDSCSDGIPKLQTVFERFDTNLSGRLEHPVDDFKIIEFNAVGVGCVHLIPAATELLQEHLLPRLKDWAGGRLVPAADYRNLLLNDLQAHARALGRAEGRIGMVERRESVQGGCDEFARIAAYFESKGVSAAVGDPREVERQNGSLLLKGKSVDVLYRDFQLEEVVSIKTHGGSVEGVEAAFTDNQVVSTVFGEFDHKSLCELLSNPDFQDYFSPLEIKAARRHIPWTRLVEERKTPDPDGKETDLIPYIRANKDRLVLKPNRSYGGEGVVVGEAVPASAWDEALNQAAAHPKSWVVQDQVKIARASLTVLTAQGKLDAGERYVTLGVTATAKGVAFVGRYSEGPVVNISQGGGLIPVFLAG